MGEVIILELCEILLYMFLFVFIGLLCINVALSIRIQRKEDELLDKILNENEEIEEE